VLLEIDVLRMLKHPNVVQMYEVYESSKYIHLLLPYLEGGELFERIKAKGLYKESDAIKVMRNFFSALKYLAENNVVHRDLKPENLILATKGDDHDLRIADFGLASFLTEEEKVLYLRCGSPGYVAPELLDDRGYDTQADVFSAGVIMYVMLTGRPLFRGENINEILEKNKNCELDFPSKYWENISPEAKDLLIQLLKKDPKERLNAA
jgi:serine/threonine protein kinase